VLTGAAIAAGNLCPNTSEPRAFAGLCASDDSSPLALLPHGHPQLATQCQEPTATQASEHQAQCFAILLVPGGFPPHRVRKPGNNHQALLWKNPHCPIKEQEPSSSTSDNLSFCGCQETCFSKAQKGPAFPNVSDHRRAHASPLKRMKK
jgi:hypothetical protein